MVMDSITGNTTGIDYYGKEMNSRFEELAKSAGIHFDDTRDNRIHYIQTTTLQKFAELIVSDSISVIQSRFMGDLNREDMEVRRIIEDIQKHFGVEK
jgi:hypothetical protein